MNTIQTQMSKRKNNNILLIIHVCTLMIYCIYVYSHSSNALVSAVVALHLCHNQLLFRKYVFVENICALFILVMVITIIKHAQYLKVQTIVSFFYHKHIANIYICTY